MKALAQIQQQLAGGEFEFSRHALRRVVERNISEQEIREAGAKAEVIENYPDESIRPARCCWDLRRLDGRYIFKYRSPSPTRRKSSGFMNLTQMNGSKTGNGGSHV